MDNKIRSLINNIRSWNKNFLNKNNATVPDKLTMKYSRKTKMWSSNHQILGEGSYGTEKWNFVFSWNCLNYAETNDDYELNSSPYWKFSLFVNKYYLDLNKDFDTKVHIVFPPDYLCNQIDNLNIDFSFSLNTITKYVRNDFVKVTEDVVINDGIGLFKTDSWKTNPLLDINLTQVPITEPFDTVLLPTA